METFKYDKGERLAKEIEKKFRLFLGDEFFEYLGREAKRRGYQYIAPVIVEDEAEDED